MPESIQHRGPGAAAELAALLGGERERGQPRQHAERQRQRHQQPRPRPRPQSPQHGRLRLSGGRRDSPWGESRRRLGRPSQPRHMQQLGQQEQRGECRIRVRHSTAVTATAVATVATATATIAAAIAAAAAAATATAAAAAAPRRVCGGRPLASGLAACAAGAGPPHPHHRAKLGPAARRGAGPPPAHRCRGRPLPPHSAPGSPHVPEPSRGQLLGALPLRPVRV
jgi:hypothetical protein